MEKKDFLCLHEVIIATKEVHFFQITIPNLKLPYYCVEKVILLL